MSPCEQVFLGLGLLLSLGSAGLGAEWVAPSRHMVGNNSARNASLSWLPDKGQRPFMLENSSFEKKKYIIFFNYPCAPVILRRTGSAAE